LELFLAQEYWRKCAHKMLAKLTTGVSIITQTVYAIQPGKNPMHYYICVGRISRNYLATKIVKLNYSVTVILTLSLFLHAFAGLRLLLVRYKSNIELQSPISSKSVLNKESLVSVTANLSSLCMILFSSSIPSELNKIDFTQLQKHYLLIHIFHHYLPQTIFAATIIIFLIKNSQLRKFLKREYLMKNPTYDCKN
jgi:hypothetical protein